MFEPMTRWFTITMLAFSLLAAQSDAISGKWVYKMDTPNGEMEVAMDLKADGTKLTGTAGIGERRFAIENGTVDGNKIKFTVKRDRPQGGTMKYEMSGTLSGSELKGTTATDLDGQPITQEWTAKKAN